MNRSILLWLLLLIILDQLVYYLSSSLVTPEILLSELNTYLDEETALGLAEKSQSTGRKVTQQVLHGMLTLIKTCGIAVIILIGYFLANVPVGVSVIFYSVTKSYPVFFFHGIVQFLYFSFTDVDYTYLELNRFNPFSFYNILSVILPHHNLNFLKAFSLLDLLFIFFVSQNILAYYESDRKKIMWITMASYLMGLAILKLMVWLIKLSI